MRLAIKINYITIGLLFLFVHSGLIKWLQWPVDPTLLFFGLVLLMMPLLNYSTIAADKNVFIILIVGAIFFLFLTLSSTYTISERYWQIKLIRILPHYITFLLPFIIIRTDNDFFVLKRIYFLFTIIVLILLYWNYLTEGLRIILVSVEGEPTGYPDYLSISFFLATAIILLLTRMKFFEYLISFLAFLMIVILGGRGPLLFLAICLFIYHWGKFSTRQLLLILGSLVLIILLFARTQYFDRSIARFSSLFELSEDKSASERITLLKSSMKIIQDNPIWGTGIGGFSMAFNQTDQRLSSHNIFLEVTTETGLIGLFIFITFLFGAVIIVLSYQPDDEYQKVLKYVCLFYFLELLVSSILEDLRIPFFWLGVTLSLFYNNKKLKDVRN